MGLTNSIHTLIPGLIPPMVLAIFFSFLFFFLLFTNYIWEIIWALSQFNLKLARIEEAHTYLFGPVNIVKEHFDQQERALQPKQFLSNLSFNSLSFAYPDNKTYDILSGMKLDIIKGQKIHKQYNSCSIFNIR